jgi:hypothetical protein
MPPLTKEPATTQASVWATIKWDWAIAGLVYLYVLLLLHAWFLSPNPEAKQPTPAQASHLVGTLSPWIIADTAPRQTGCQQASCDYLAIRPVAGEKLPTRMMALYQAPPAQLLSAPPGYVFRPQQHNTVVYAQRRRENLDEFALPVLFPEKPDERAAPSSPASLIVASPGYVRFDQPAAGDTPATATPEPARQMTFLPFEERFEVQLHQAPPYAMGSGDTLAIGFPGGPPGEQGDSLPGNASAFEPVQVLAVEAEPADRRWRMKLQVTPAQALRLMQQRLRIEPPGATWASPAFSTEIALEFRSQSSTAASQAMRLPATAVLAQGGHSRVWLALEGLAIPVLVKELQRLNDSVLVTEAAGARGLPIAQKDWLAMGALARREAMRAASARMDSGENKLLTASAAVIVQPDAALKPAAAVKVRHD